MKAVHHTPDPRLLNMNAISFSIFAVSEFIVTKKIQNSNSKNDKNQSQQFLGHLEVEGRFLKDRRQGPDKQMHLALCLKYFCLHGFLLVQKSAQCP